MTDYTKIENKVNVQADVIWYMALNVWEFAKLGYVENRVRLKNRQFWK